MNRRPLRILLLAAIAIITIATGAVAHADNIVGNGGFEPADPWIFIVRSPAACSLSRDSSVVHGGLASEHIGITTASTNWYCQLYQFPAFVAGASYTLSFWAKAEAAHPIDAVIYNYTNDAHVLDVYPALTVTWTQYSYVFTAPTSTLLLIFDLATQAGDVWIDDVSIATSAAPRASTLVVMNNAPSQIALYHGLENTHDTVWMRNVNAGTAELDTFDANNFGYLYTAASSDYDFNNTGQPIYIPMNTLTSYENRTRQPKGFYLHEVTTYFASRNGWNWQVATDTTFDWNWMDQLVALAKQHGQTVMWNEPSLGWQYLYQSSVAAPHLASYGTTLVPTFATNFAGRLADSRQYAIATAQRYGMFIGESHQDWYFYDNNIPITESASYDLAKSQGLDYGARYFQFEGLDTDLMWTSPYMLGVRDFANYLGTLPLGTGPAAVPASRTSPQIAAPKSH